MSLGAGHDETDVGNVFARGGLAAQIDEGERRKPARRNRGTVARVHDALRERRGEETVGILAGHDVRDGFVVHRVVGRLNRVAGYVEFREAVAKINQTGPGFLQGAELDDFIRSCFALDVNVVQELLEQYNASDPEAQADLQQQFNDFLEKYNLDEVDLGSLADTDIAEIISGLQDNTALNDIFGLMQEAWASGTDMIKDALSGGFGTSDGSNTATTVPMETQPTNVIIAGTAPVGTTAAVGVTNSGSTTTETTTYNVGETTAPAIVGAGVTVGETASNPVISDSDTMSSSSIIVLIVLSIATLAVIAALVIFFVLKRR